jgi:arginyl-tRNA synthetase
LGHTRCAAIGDCICNLYTEAGYDVTREYYVNDCGNQIEHLGHSIRARYHEQFGEPLALGEDDYHGVDLIDLAKDIKAQFGDKYLQDNQESHDFFIRFGIDHELAKIKKDMADFGVHWDVFSYESDIRKGATIPDTIKGLAKYTYVQDGATYLKTTAFLDDKDRPIVKSNGQYTYFMPDIHLSDFPSMIEAAAKERAPYKVAGYIQKLATLIHEFYAACRVIDRDNIPLTSSRLALIKSCMIVLENALGLLGVSAPDKM